MKGMQEKEDRKICPSRDHSLTSLGKPRDARQ